ncbi:hypothetical protein FACS1894172_17970 [Spirochaetia bacterium]|nr:hypothetical protein FACS1894172_17970 [Spirochaetia bacterium]
MKKNLFLIGLLSIAMALVITGCPTDGSTNPGGNTNPDGNTNPGGNTNPDGNTDFEGTWLGANTYKGITSFLVQYIFSGSEFFLVTTEQGYYDLPNYDLPNYDRTNGEWTNYDWANHDWTNHDWTNYAQANYEWTNYGKGTFTSTSTQLIITLTQGWNEGTWVTVAEGNEISDTTNYIISGKRLILTYPDSPFSDPIILTKQ